MLKWSLLQERQLRLPSLFLRVTVIAAFMMTSAWIAWQLHARPYDDLPTFYWATQLAFDQGLSAYQPSHFQALGQALGRKIYPFLYPPPSLFLFSPVLLCVDYEQCKIIFSGLNLLLWWALVWFIYSFYGRCIDAKHKPFFTGVLILSAMLVYTPLIDTLKNGQINLVVLLCLMPALLAPVGRSQQMLSGFLLACAIVLKVYVLLLLPVMLIFGRWREAITSVLFLGLLIVLSVVLLPQSMWREWLSLSASAGYGKGIPYVLTIPFNQSINGFFIRHFLDLRGVGQPMHWVFLIYGFALVCMTAVAYVIFKYLRHQQQGSSAALALTLLLINLIAPLTWLHHYVFALPAIAWVAALLLQARRTGQRMFTVWLFGVAVGLLAVPFISVSWLTAILSQPEPGKGMGLAYNLALSTPLVAAMAIFAIFIGLVIRRR